MRIAYLLILAALVFVACSRQTPEGAVRITDLYDGSNNLNIIQHATSTSIYRIGTNVSATPRDMLTNMWKGNPPPEIIAENEHQERYAQSLDPATLVRGHVILAGPFDVPASKQSRLRRLLLDEKVFTRRDCLCADRLTTVIQFRLGTNTVDVGLGGREIVVWPHSGFGLARMQRIADRLAKLLNAMLPPSQHVQFNSRHEH